MKLTTVHGLNAEDSKLIVESVAQGVVNLLLGAGASYGCSGGDGSILKGGPDLARELVSHFNLPLEEPDCSNLSLVYQDLDTTHSHGKLHNFLIQKFSNCKPEWQRSLTHFNWKRIWSLNIDDVIEQAFKGSTAETQRLSVFNWPDTYKPRPLQSDESEVQLVHLHGEARSKTQIEKGLIFSLKEYATRSENSPGWHSAFRQEFAQKPFVVIGARLQDEFDLITVIEFGNKSKERGGCPSVIVLPKFAPGQEARCKRYGLIPITADGATFISNLKDDVGSYLDSKEVDAPASMQAMGEMASKFRRLELISSPTRDKKKQVDYFATAEASWDDILENLDSPFAEAEPLVSWFNDTKSTVQIAIVIGGPVSGKSTFSYRLANELLIKSKKIYKFRAEESIDVELVHEYCKKNANSVLVFDDCADFSNSISQLANLAISRSTNLRMILTCDTKRSRGVLADIDESFSYEVWLDPISYKNFDSIFNGRSFKGRLGRCTGMSVREAWVEFRDDYSSRLLEWLESLENARPYKVAIDDIFAEQTTTPSIARNLIYGISAVQRFGYSLPVHLMQRYLRGAPLDAIVGEDGELADICHYDERGLRLRSSAFARYVWTKLSQNDKYVCSLTLAKQLAPLVVPLSITRRALPFLIFRQLMDWEVVREDFGKDANRWYGELEGAMGWNSRFWEQRALLLTYEGVHTTAYSYAKKAAKLHAKDAFVWTTLGKVCVNLGVNQRDKIGVAKFWEGVQCLETSRNLAIQANAEWEHPYVTFFNSAIKAAKLQHFEIEKIKLSSAWVDWMRAAKYSRVFRQRGEHARLAEFEQRWLLTAVQT
jgi:SIR2-like domain